MENVMLRFLLNTEVVSLIAFTGHQSSFHLPFKVSLISQCFVCYPENNLKYFVPTCSEAEFNFVNVHQMAVKQLLWYSNGKAVVQYSLQGKCSYSAVVYIHIEYQQKFSALTARFFTSGEIKKLNWKCNSKINCCCGNIKQLLRRKHFQCSGKSILLPTK